VNLNLQLPSGPRVAGYLDEFPHRIVIKFREHFAQCHSGAVGRPLTSAACLR
jgi:hypothetical protein